MRRPRSRRDGAIERPSASGCREYSYGGFGGGHHTSTRTPSSGNPAEGFQERPRRAQEDGEGGRGPGVGVVLAEDAAAAGDDVVVQLPGRPVLAQLEQRGGEDEGGGGRACRRPAPGPPARGPPAG